MNTDTLFQLPYLVIDMLRHRQKSLCLSPLSNSFKWSIFSKKLLPRLGQKGNFDKNSLQLLIPISTLNHGVECYDYDFVYKTEANYTIPICVNFVEHVQRGLDNLAICVLVTDKGASREMFEDFYVRCLKELITKLDIMNISFVTETSQSINKELINMMDIMSNFKTISINYNLMVLSGHDFGINSLDSEKILYKRICQNYSSLFPFEVNINDGMTIKHVVECFAVNRYILKEGLDSVVKDLNTCLSMIGVMKMAIELNFDPDYVEVSLNWLRELIDECLCDSNTGKRYLTLIESLAPYFVKEVYTDYIRNSNSYKNELQNLLSNTITSKIHLVCYNTITKIKKQ